MFSFAFSVIRLYTLSPILSSSGRMSPPIDDQRPLLDVRSTDRSYGATGEDVVSSSDSTRAASPVKKPDEEVKENKQFREIWALCLGLWTAYVSSPMAISLTR